jgi:hypothetical protein
VVGCDILVHVALVVFMQQQHTGDVLQALALPLGK